MNSLTATIWQPPANQTWGIRALVLALSSCRIFLLFVEMCTAILLLKSGQVDKEEEVVGDLVEVIIISILVRNIINFSGQCVISAFCIARNGLSDTIDSPTTTLRVKLYWRGDILGQRPSGRFGLMAYQPLMSYLIPKFDYFVNIWNWVYFQCSIVFFKILSIIICFQTFIWYHVFLSNANYTQLRIWF